MKGRVSFRICGRDLTLPETPELPDLRWEEPVQANTVKRKSNISGDHIGTGNKGQNSVKRVVRRKRAGCPT